MTSDFVPATRRLLDADDRQHGDDDRLPYDLFALEPEEQNQRRQHGNQETGCRRFIVRSNAPSPLRSRTLRQPCSPMTGTTM
jgi:hypothetical protein